MTVRSALRAPIRAAVRAPIVLRKPWTPADLFSQGQTLVFNYVDGRYATKSLVDGSIDYSTIPSDLMTVQRASPKWVYDETGTLVEVPVDTLAIQHDPLTGKSLGALIEESRTNLLLWSDDFTNAVWTGGGYSLSAYSGEAPLSSGYLMTATGEESQFHYIRCAYRNTGGAVVTASWVVKPVENCAGIRLAFTTGTTLGRFDFATEAFYGQSEVILNTHSEALSDGFYLLSITLDDPERLSVAPFVYLQDENGNEFFDATNKNVSLALGYCQLEEGTVPSSYIPTTDSPVTRAADNVSRELDDEYDPDAGTYTIRAAVPPGETVATLGSVSVTSTSDEMTTYTLSYSSDPGATGLVLGNGRFESIEYAPGVS